MNCVKNLQKLEEEVKTITEKYGLTDVAKILVVTKYVTNEKIQEIHSYNPKYHFGENYVDALIEKARTLPKSIKWHFIGHLQTNKCKYLARIKNLYLIETIDSLKLAVKLNEALKKIKENNEEEPLKKKNIENNNIENNNIENNNIENNNTENKKYVENKVKEEKSESESETNEVKETKNVNEIVYTEEEGIHPKRLGVLVQIKTSSDENKTGLIHTSYLEIENLILHIIEKCEHLIFRGLMTISSLKEHEKENSFVILNEIKKKILQNPTINNCFKNKKFIMSMGMSGDMEMAIKHHSTQLRIGSAIFK